MTHEGLELGIVFANVIVFTSVLVGQSWGVKMWVNGQLFKIMLEARRALEVRDMEAKKRAMLQDMVAKGGFKSGIKRQEIGHSIVIKEWCRSMRRKGKGEQAKDLLVQLCVMRSEKEKLEKKQTADTDRGEIPRSNVDIIT